MEYDIKIEQDDKISISYKDKKYFGETMRFIYINLGEKAEECSIEISSENVNPIIYSDETYTSNTQNKSDIFSTPLWPPKELEFNYITDSYKDTTVIVEAVYPTENPKKYIKRIAKLNINAETSDKKGE